MESGGDGKGKRCKVPWDARKMVVVESRGAKKKKKEKKKLRLSRLFASGMQKRGLRMGRCGER